MRDDGRRLNSTCRLIAFSAQYRCSSRNKSGGRLFQENALAGIAIWAVEFGKRYGRPKRTIARVALPNMTDLTVAFVLGDFGNRTKLPASRAGRPSKISLMFILHWSGAM